MFRALSLLDSSQHVAVKGGVNKNGKALKITALRRGTLSSS